MTLSTPSKYLANVSGVPTQTTTISASSGTNSAYLVPCLNAAGQIDLTMMPTGVGPDTALLVATETISAGAVVNVWNNSGTPSVRNADQSSSSKSVSGYILSSVTSSQNATVYFNSTITGLSGLTPGATYFLGSVGAVTTSAPSSVGTISQQVGTAVTAATFQFNPQQYIQN